MSVIVAIAWVLLLALVFVICLVIGACAFILWQLAKRIMNASV